MAGSSTGRRGAHVAGAALLAAALFVAFVALGVWQVQRLAWKTQLIADVDARIHAAPIPAPGPAAWGAIRRETDAYRRVAVRGVYVAGQDTRVQAVTELGAGDWVLTPLRAEQGFVVLVNRGFVPDGQSHGPPPRDAQRVVGLVRITEPGGGFLRRNDPAGDRWYSRDVAAIARARGLPSVAPYFIDAEAGPVADAWPRGGLTVVRFPNSHLAYAVTWFAMAALTLVGFAVFRRHMAKEPE